MWASGHNGEIRRAVHGYEPDARGGDGRVREKLAPLSNAQARRCSGAYDLLTRLGRPVRRRPGRDLISSRVRSLAARLK
jgi:hypothetical protein